MASAMHTFITSRLDYCSAKYFGLKTTTLNTLQLVQNAAERTAYLFSNMDLGDSTSLLTVGESFKNLDTDICPFSIDH